MTLEDENLVLRAACRTLEGVVATETSARRMCEMEKAELLAMLNEVTNWFGNGIYAPELREEAQAVYAKACTVLDRIRPVSTNNFNVSNDSKGSEVA